MIPTIEDLMEWRARAEVSLRRYQMAHPEAYDWTPWWCDEFCRGYIEALRAESDTSAISEEDRRSKASAGSMMPDVLPAGGVTEWFVAGAQAWSEDQEYQSSEPRTLN